MIEISDLWKRYPGTWALQGVTLSIPTGRVVGILGENGSGKSTLLRIVGGLTRPTKGVVSIDGRPVGLETRRRVAYLPEVDPFYTWMTIREQLAYLSAFYPKWDTARSDELVAAMGLKMDQKFGALSRGMRARLKVVAAFSWPSAVVLLDEPFGGVDAPSRKRIMAALFREYRAGEQTVLLTTHLVDEVEEFVEDAVFVQNGSVVAQGNADELRRGHGTSLSGIMEGMVA